MAVMLRFGAPLPLGSQGPLPSRRQKGAQSVGVVMGHGDSATTWANDVGITFVGVRGWTRLALWGFGGELIVTG